MIYLSSQSPRRAELLRAAGLVFEVIAVDIDEAPLVGEPPEAYVRRLAETKARVGYEQQHQPDAFVLGADTAVFVDGAVLGKPADDAEARAMLRLLSGRAHEVLTGVALVSNGRVTSDVARTQVWFASLTDDEIAAYVATGEPRDKAGAYAVQGQASRFVVRIDGSYTNVVGLPVALVYRMLEAARSGRQCG